mgnify:CR=1 FL=1
MVEEEEVSRYQMILENLEALADILDILHVEVSALKETVHKIENKLDKLQNIGKDTSPSHPMFG